MVKRRANRIWKDADAAAEHFSSEPEAFTRKLLSPAKMEKLVGKSGIGDLCESPDKGNTIAAATDRRKAVSPSALTDFQDIN